MKTLLIGAAVAATLFTTLAADARPRAYGGSWCLNVKEARGGYYRCDYATYDQCMASRTANGEWCMQNPALSYQPGPRYYR